MRGQIEEVVEICKYKKCIKKKRRIFTFPTFFAATHIFGNYLTITQIFSVRVRLPHIYNQLNEFISRFKWITII